MSRYEKYALKKVKFDATSANAQCIVFFRLDFGSHIPYQTNVITTQKITLLAFLFRFTEAERYITVLTYDILFVKSKTEKFFLPARSQIPFKF